MVWGRGSLKVLVFGSSRSTFGNKSLIIVIGKNFTGRSNLFVIFKLIRFYICTVQRKWVSARYSITVFL